MKKLTKAALVLTVSSGAIVAGSLAGFTLAMATAPTPITAHTQSGGESIRPVGEYPTNESGQTYGLVDQGLLSDPSERPQLVLVTTDDGIEGYAFYDELFPATQATSAAQARSLSTDQSYEVPVYETDGRTLLGVHTVNRLPED